MRGRSKYVIASTLAAIHYYLPRNTWKPHLIGEQTDPWVRPPLFGAMSYGAQNDLDLLYPFYRIPLKR